MALAIVASPLALTSCDDDPWGDNNYYYNETSAKPSFIEKIYLVVFRIILQRVYWYN